jgi:hypothetical protein
MCAESGETLVAARAALANWDTLHAKVRELALAGVPADLRRKVDVLLFEVHSDMRARYAFYVLHMCPRVQSHQDLKTWCETLHLALFLPDELFAARVDGRPVKLLHVAFPLLAEACRNVWPEQVPSSLPPWDETGWHEQLSRLVVAPLPRPLPFLVEQDFLTLTDTMWSCMRRLGGAEMPAEPTSVPDARATRHILDTVKAWCERQPGQPEEREPATVWEFVPGRFRFRGEWYDLANNSLRLLEAFTRARAMTLTEDQISRMTSPRVSPGRVYGRVAELRMALQGLLKLPAQHDPRPSVDRGAWRLDLP